MISYNFIDVAKPNNWPTQFRYIVLAETCSTGESERDPVTGLNINKLRTMYVAVALEWHLIAQGSTIQEAIDVLERLFLTQAAIQLRYPDAKEPSPAPEDYQRVATSGDYARVGGPRVAQRGVLDMAQSQYRLEPSPGN